MLQPRLPVPHVLSTSASSPHYRNSRLQQPLLIKAILSVIGVHASLTLQTSLFLKHANKVGSVDNLLRARAVFVCPYSVIVPLQNCK